MRKLHSSLIFLIIITASCFSQAEKKTWLLGGYAAVQIESEGYGYLDVNPNTGYFIKDKLCIGLSIPIVSYDFEEFHYGINPYAKYFFRKNSPRSLFIFGQVGLNSLLNNDNNISYGTIALGFGHTWFLNKNIGFDGLIIGGTNFETVALGIFFGFDVYFNKATKNQ
jgi:hypothetical protein